MINIKNKNIVLISSVFVALSIWWLTIYFRGLHESIENEVFTDIYFITSLWGGIAGLFVSKSWGGHKSSLGRAIGAFSIGLLGQAFGQVAYNFYAVVLKVEIPYPSIGDFGFFSTAFIYSYGLIELAKVFVNKVTIKTFRGRGVAVILPLLFMVGTFYVFLRGYTYEWQHPVRVMMDLSWPIIDSFFLSLAILVLLLSRNFLGGLMKGPIWFLLAALIFEAVADLNFIYQFSQDKWYAGGINDFMYLIAYTLMAIALMRIGMVFKKINEEQI